MMKIAVGQINPIVGDFAGNRAKIIDFVRQSGDVEMAVFPELALSGYPPMDLLDQEAFADESIESLRALQRELPPGIAVAVGYVDTNRTQSGKPLENSVAVILDGEVVFRQSKTLLPTYDVFDEARYFESAKDRNVFSFKGCRIGIAICEDIWWETEQPLGMKYPVDPVRDLLDSGIDLMIVPSASPFHRGKFEIRKNLVSKIAREGGIPVVYVNMAGADDSLVFDGRSFLTDSHGQCVRALGFDEELGIFETTALAQGSVPRDDPWGDVKTALVTGIRDYMVKCGFKDAHVGLSGGIDSALVAALAVEAIGRDHVRGFAMPSRFSSDGSKTDAYALAKNLGIVCETIPIEGPFKAFLDTLSPTFGDKPFDVTEENLQARVRGTILMAYSNKFNSMLLTTGNKSELATGYCTLYGDMCGALAVIGDLLKTEVYEVTRRLNREREIIPLSTIEKAPSAELRENQTDQDSLPPYDVLDAILELYLVKNLARDEIVSRGFDQALVHRIITMVAKAEYKRRQAPPVIKVSPRAFGMGRRMPIARKIYES